MGQCNHKCPSKKEARVSRVRESNGICYTGGTEVGGRGHEPRNVASLQKPKKTRKQILPQSLQKKCSCASTFVLAS